MLRVKFVCAHCRHGIYGEYSVRIQPNDQVLRYHKEEGRDCKALAEDEEMQERIRQVDDEWEHDQE